MEPTNSTKPADRVNRTEDTPRQEEDARRRFEGPSFAEIFAEYLKRTPSTEVWEIIDACAESHDAPESVGESASAAAQRRRYFSEQALIARMIPPGHPLRDRPLTYTDAKALAQPRSVIGGDPPCGKPGQGW